MYDVTTGKKYPDSLEELQAEINENIKELAKQVVDKYPHVYCEVYHEKITDEYPNTSAEVQLEIFSAALAYNDEKAGV
jgi:hypothetical protein